MSEALRSAHHSGDGPWTRRVTDALCEMTGGGRAFLTPSGTDSLELACMAIGIGPGDEVIVPSFTFSSTATAVERTGATVRFADVDPITLNLDASRVLERITDRTKAVITVHYGGQAGDLAELQQLLSARGIALVEDAAHALGGTWTGAPFGSFGALSCFSFHETKNLSCGEGGALVVNDPALEDAVEKIREKGTDRSQFFRGQVDKYTWVSPGSSFLLSDILAAVLAAGLDDWATTQATRQSAWQAYETRLAAFAQANDFDVHPRLAGNEHPAHLFYLMAPTATARDAMLAHCRANEVLAVSHYQPLAESLEGRRASRPYRDDCPVSADVSARLLRLPLFSAIREDEVDRVVETIEAWTPTGR